MGDHLINMLNRQELELSGVKNVITFDEEEIILETVMGYLYIKGEGLHITNLSLQEGKVALQGNINSLDYKEQGTDMKTRGQNIFKRILR